MIWRSWEGLDHVGDKAAMKGHKVVLAPQARQMLIPVVVCLFFLFVGSAGFSSKVL